MLSEAQKALRPTGVGASEWAAASRLEPVRGTWQERSCAPRTIRRCRPCSAAPASATRRVPKWTAMGRASPLVVSRSTDMPMLVDSPHKIAHRPIPATGLPACTTRPWREPSSRASCSCPVGFAWPVPRQPTACSVASISVASCCGLAWAPAAAVAAHAYVADPAQSPPALPGAAPWVCWRGTA